MKDARFTAWAQCVGTVIIAKASVKPTISNGGVHVTVNWGEVMTLDQRQHFAQTLYKATDGFDPEYCAGLWYEIETDSRKLIGEIYEQAIAFAHITPDDYDRVPTVVFNGIPVRNAQDIQNGSDYYRYAVATLSRHAEQLLNKDAPTEAMKTPEAAKWLQKCIDGGLLDEGWGPGEELKSVSLKVLMAEIVKSKFGLTWDYFSDEKGRWKLKNPAQARAKMRESETRVKGFNAIKNVFPNYPSIKQK